VAAAGGTATNAAAGKAAPAKSSREETEAAALAAAALAPGLVIMVPYEPPREASKNKSYMYLLASRYYMYVVRVKLQKMMTMAPMHAHFTHSVQTVR